MIIVINDTLGAYGGTHTLTIRACTWLKKNGIDTAIFCDSMNNSEAVEILENNNTDIFCFDTHNTKATYKMINTLLEKNKSIKVLSYMWDKYLDIEVVKNIYGLSFNNMLYCVHYGTFMRGSTYPTVIKRMIKSRYRKIFDRMVLAKSIVMMDEDTTNKTFEWFGIDKSCDIPIVRIPMICKEIDDAERIIDFGYNSNILMTASRAEFPYKGYLLGLISLFAELKKEYTKIKLVIVTGGEKNDIKKIVDEINLLPIDIKEDVELIKWVEYSELMKKMEKCKLFIGMGTSVLDAGLKYKPVIPVKYNSYDVLASNFLSQKPWLITSEEECVESAYSLISTVLGYEKHEYMQEAYKSFEAVKECYDIDKNMKHILNISPLNNKVVNYGDMVMIKILYCLSRIKHRSNKLFDIGNIEKDNNEK